VTRADRHEDSTVQQQVHHDPIAPFAHLIEQQAPRQCLDGFDMLIRVDGKEARDYWRCGKEHAMMAGCRGTLESKTQDMVRLRCRGVSSKERPDHEVNDL